MGVTAKIARKKYLELPKSILGNTKAKVGWPASKVNQEIVNKAIWTNFGTINMPERPALSNAFDNNRSNYIDALKKSAPKVLRGEVNVGQIISKIGILFSDDVKQEIVDLDSPANAPSTIKKKGSSNPLIDTGEMKNSVTHETYD